MGGWVRISGSGFRLSGLLLMVLVCRTWSASSSEFESLFHHGSQAYAAGGFEQAAGYFEDALKLSPSSGALHNLGNAEWQRGRTGYAILAWERAQWLHPYNANTRANLRFARKTAQLDSPDFAWYEICSKWLPVDMWAWLAGVSLWVAISMVMLPGILRWRKADWHQGLAAAGFAMFLLSIPAMIGVQSRSQRGVVLSRETPLRLTPTHEAQVLTKLPAGDMVRLERERGDYVYVRAGNDAAGWVERSQFGRISAL
jgi:tetratricopeptide (TPR) repeat protein